MSTEPVTVVTPPKQPSVNPSPAAPVQVSGTTPTPATNADLSPPDRFLDMRDGANRARIGDRALSETEYNQLTFSERLEYAERRTDLANGNGNDPAATADSTTATAPGSKVQVGRFEISEGELAAMMERQAND